MTIQITVIGLEKIGSSIGLALKKHSQQITRTGHDRRNANNKKALEIGAFDKTPSHLREAIVDADIVILALPVDEIRETIEIIAPDLKPGAVLLDTSFIKLEVMEWIKELLPEDRYFLGFQPTINPLYLAEPLNDIAFAHEDLFQNAYILISNPSKMDGEAIKLASDLTKFLGGNPYFVDPYEIDGINAGTEILPQILRTAYINLLTNRAGWREGQKIAGHAFFNLSEPIHDFAEREQFGEAAKLNKDNSVQLINEMLILLRDYRDLIQNEEWEELHNQILHAQQEQTDWKASRAKANWDNLDEARDIPTTGDFFRQMVGIRKKRK